MLFVSPREKWDKSIWTSLNVCSCSVFGFELWKFNKINVSASIPRILLLLSLLIILTKNFFYQGNQSLHARICCTVRKKNTPLLKSILNLSKSRWLTLNLPIMVFPNFTHVLFYSFSFLSFLSCLNFFFSLIFQVSNFSNIPFIFGFSIVFSNWSAACNLFKNFCNCVNDWLVYCFTSPISPSFLVIALAFFFLDLSFFYFGFFVINMFSYFILFYFFSFQYFFAFIVTDLLSPPGKWFGITTLSMYFFLFLCLIFSTSTCKTFLICLVTLNKFTQWCCGLLLCSFLLFTLKKNYSEKFDETTDNSLLVTPREKCPNAEFLLVRIFPHSDWTRRYEVSPHIQYGCGKIRTRK